MRAAPWITRLAVGIGTLAFATALVCLDRVDQRPYTDTPFYTETAAVFPIQADSVHPVTGQLAAGFGRALLTPSLNAKQDDPGRGEFRSLPLAGYGSRKGKPTLSAHDDLYIKAVALQVGDKRVVMVSADALIVPREIAESATAKLAPELGLRRDEIYFGATHTHASLGAWGEGFVAEAFAGDFQPGVRVWWTDRITTAVREAFANLRPATFGRASFAVPELVRNRLNGSKGVVNVDFDFLVVQQKGRGIVDGAAKLADGTIGIVGSYGAHATVLPSGFMQFSGDYPGVWQRAVEEATGGIALFFAGSVGSQSPVPVKGNLTGAEQMGQSLSGMVLERLPSVSRTQLVTLATMGVELNLPPPQVRVSEGIRLRPWLARHLLPVGTSTFLQALRLNDTVWIGTPCDFSGELAVEIKNSFRPKGFEVTMTSFNGDYVGYVIPSRYYHLDGYEPRVMSFFGPQMPDYLVDFAVRLTLATARDPN